VKRLFFAIVLLFIGTGWLTACTAGKPAGAAGGLLHVLAVETFLGDIAQNVAGERLKVGTLMPIGLDPHAFQPTPSDVVKIANSQVLIVNGTGLETWLDETLQNAGGKREVVEASAGLQPRKPASSERVDEAQDPHFWLDPLSVIHYVENIRDGLVQADPEGEAIYTQNAEKYSASLQDLDAWIRGQVEQIPAGQRLLVTNHENFGYFADRYGFKVIGTIIPSTSTEAEPSAEQMAALIETIRSNGVKAVFLETGTNQDLADQISRETGAKVVSGLYSHSITGPGGPAPTYIDMMKYNTQLIVDALK
jgi:ABC-type Zn uptake system ZnuABC Zn-binding protein ZnuA